MGVSYRRRRAFLALGLALMLGACGTAPATPTVIPTPTPVAATATTSTEESTPTVRPVIDLSNHIVYLAPDGVTVTSVMPDGTGMQALAVISKQPHEEVTLLSAGPNGEYVVYTLSSTDPASFSLESYIIHNGKTLKLAPLAGQLRWSPDGSRFVAQRFAFDEPGAIYLYDTGAAVGETLPVQGSPDWYPDGKRLLYSLRGNIFSYDLATQASSPLTTLPYDENNRWSVQEAHVLPGADRIIFFGEQEVEDGQYMLGPHSDIQVWWRIPLSGGDPRHWGEIIGMGSGVGNFAPNPRDGKIAFSQAMYGGAVCGSYHHGVVAAFDDPDDTLPPSEPITATTALLTGIDPNGTWRTLINGVSWSPDGSEFAYGVERHACSGGEEPPAPPDRAIHIWNGDPDSDVRASIDGSYPTWVR